MTFLSPLFLVGALAAAIPLAIHLFHRRADPVVEFAALRYLRQVAVEQSRPRRFRELILLALRITALLLLALAFARPYLPAIASAAQSAATVVLVDTSASLSAPGQFERAKVLAREAVSSAPAGDTVGVMAFSTGADVVAPLSRDRAGALTAAEGLERRDGATSYGAALARAAEAIGDRRGRIVVITDLQQTGWDVPDEEGVPERLTVEVLDVDGPGANAAVMSLEVDGSNAVAVIRNYSTQQAELPVSFALDGQPIGSLTVSVPAAGAADAIMPLGAAFDVEQGTEARTLTASVQDAEGYAADNVRYAVLDPGEATSVLAISASGNRSELLYLERALSIAAGKGGFRLETVGGPAFARFEPGRLADVDVIVVLGTRGLESHGRSLLGDYARRGGSLLIAAGPDVEGEIVARALEGLLETTWTSRPPASLTFAPVDSRHPIFRVFGGLGSLGSVAFTRAALVSPGTGATVLARYSDSSPALVEEPLAEGRALIFASDLNDRWNDFPVQPAFVPFVHEALRYLAPSRTSRNEYLVGELTGAGHKAGITYGAEPGRAVALNIDIRESDPARMTSGDFEARVARLHSIAAREASAAAREREDGQHLWQAALLLMVVGLAAEGAIGRRLG